MCERLGHEKEERYRTLYRPHLAPHRGAEELLARLRARGLKLAVASSAPEANRALVLDGLEWHTRFDVVVAAEGLRGKPAPDIYLAAAKAMDPRMTFIFVSGQGADRDVMRARVKKRTEDDLRGMPFKAVYVFRPGFIQPLDGIRSRTRLYNILYPLMYPLMLGMKLFAPRSITDTRRVGRAMLEIAKRGYPKIILENPDINAAAAGPSQ